MDDRVATALCVLGPLEVVREGEPVRLGSGQQRRVLAALLVHANEVVSSDRLVDVLWGDEPPPSATHTLQALVSRLRATLGEDRLETRAPGYRLRVANGEADVLRFEELVRVGLGAAAQPEVALRAFDEAVGLWRGSPYAEFASEEFAAPEVARLVELHARAIEERAAALLELSRPEEVIGELEAEIAAAPFRERLRALLMLALARAGRPVESLRAYDAFRRFLADEVGVVPSPGLQELNDDIVRQHPDVSWAGSPGRDTGRPDLPSGTVTFLFTDVEGSTRLWEEFPDMPQAMARHDELLRNAVEAHGGHAVKTTGDGLHAVFSTAHDAVTAAVGAQTALLAEDWNITETVRVRMGIHTGVAEVRDGDYYGSVVNRAARVMSVAHGGQVIVSAATEELLHDALPEKYGFVDLGEHRLRDLGRPERLFQVTHPDLGREFAPLRTLDAFSRNNLPRQVTTFVGREAEIASVAELVRETPLVTLTGVGGVGKTRLALQVAADVVTEFPDGVWLCEFAPVTDPEAVWETLATSLRVQPPPGRALDESVLDYLAAKRLLLVLDNCEHLLDAVARQVDAITQRCARVSVLATSREGLGLAGERMVAVPSLGVPASDADVDELRRVEAVCLFWDRASAAKSDFALTDRNVGAVGELCRRLDGIPLAIELAAARVRSLSPDDLVARLDQRFKLLTHGSRAVLERHQTLRSTIDWSYDLLTPTERHALQRLSIFAGGCDLAAAEAVLPGDMLDASDVIDVFSQLVDKSLVVVDDTDGGVRYRLLETIRQYARERLDASGDPVALRRRHADHYVALAETAGPHLRSQDHLEWTSVVTRDVDNCRAALDWAVETPSPEHALRLVAPLAVQGRTGELAMDWAATASTIPGGDTHPLLPAVVAWAAWGAMVAGDLERAEALVAIAERAQAALGTRLSSVPRAQAILAFFRGDFEEARRHAGEWVELARTARDPYELAHALVMLASALQITEPTLDAAIAAGDEAARVARTAGIDSALSFGLPNLANWLPYEESERALTLLDEATEVSTRIGDRWGVAHATHQKGHIAARRGEWRTALRAIVDASDQNLQLGALANVGLCHLAGVAFWELRLFEPAAVLIGKSDAMTELSAPDWVLEMKAAADAALREALGEPQVARLAEQGAALDIADAVAYLHAEADQALRQD
ncbi:MAG: BTAD domain-containing putative transcriptional regulator [Acidimicrobiia bacterium]